MTAMHIALNLTWYGRIRVRRQQHEAYNEDCIVPRVQAGGGGVTIWGVLHHGGKCVSGYESHRELVVRSNPHHKLFPFKLWQS